MKPRAGSREVWTVTIILQSTTAATGRILPSTVAAHRSTSSSARSSTSVCGYSLKATITSAYAVISGVRWQCGSSSAPITTSGPTMARTRCSRSPSQSS
ncbi:hypothetical protein D9M72_520990 [compost metagenome]